MFKTIIGMVLVGVLAANVSSAGTTHTAVLKEALVGNAYDDSWQTTWVPLDKSALGIVYRTWRLKTRALRHQKVLRVVGPDNNDVRDKVTVCFGTGAVAGAFAGVFTGGQAAMPAFQGALGACLGAEVISSTLDDVSHWTQWQ
jgi:hypothetical protein